MKKKTESRKRPSPSAGKAIGEDLVVKLQPTGPDRATFDSLSRELLQHPSLKEYLKRARSRVLSVEPIDTQPESKTSRSRQPERFSATIYDYTNGRTIRVIGSLDDRKRIEVSESGHQPLPTSEEFDEAVKVLAKDNEIGSMLSQQQLRPYPPMPPLIEAQQPDGRSQRIIAVGLLPTSREGRHEIVGVNMNLQEVIRFERGAPSATLAGDTTCGIPYAGQETTGRQYAAGQVWVTVTQGKTVLWKFLVIRPAATQGPGSSTRGTGVELRFVDYRGKRVLYRAHVPILNVRYDKDVCGPFRDWQNEEGMIDAIGKDVAPGFRLCPTPAKTILDSGSDTGNFLGVAIYVQGQEVVLVSEMEAGWYRYISQWRLHANGTIRPRFGFSAVNTSSCVCNRHHHHAYWRFDFDIRTPGNNIVREFNDPPIVGSSNWHTKSFEIKRFRDPAHKRKWRVENTSTGEAYDIIPGPDDGVATASSDWPYPRGDVWVLRYHGNEIDDGVDCTTGGPGCNTEAQLDGFVNGESVNNQDVVIWYAGHVTHDVATEPPGEFGHIVGPDLKPAKW